MTRLLQSLYITLISIGLFAVLAAILPGIDMFEPVSRALSEVTITDLHYSSMRDATPMENDKILIIDTSASDRSEIADAIEQAATAGAAVIGVDIIFSDRDADREATSKLCRTLSAHKDRIVGAIHLTQWDEETGGYISTVTTATDSLPLQQGYTNLIDASDNSYIRNYSAAPQGVTPSFPQAMAEMYRASFGDTSPTEATDCGIIDFTPQDFKTVGAADSAGIATYSEGRMVILGALASDEDYHFTPIGKLSGAIIQAYSLDTILNDETIQTPGWVTWIVCLVTVFIASWGFVELRRNFEHRNPTANRYTYAVLGLGNIMYPTVIILLTVFVMGLIYILSSIYIAPLVIMGSLAFIPVAYDLMGIAKEVFRKRARTAATSALMIFAAAGANAAGNTATPVPSGYFTAVSETHDLTVNGKLGVQINVSFNIDNMKGRKGKVVAFFYDENRKDIKTTFTNYRTTGGTLYSREWFTPKYDNSIYTNVHIFLPLETLPKSSETKVIKYTVYLYDDKDKVLDSTTSHSFYCSPYNSSTSKYHTPENVSGNFLSVSTAQNSIKDGLEGMTIKSTFNIDGMKDKQGSIYAFFYKESPYGYKQLTGNGKYSTKSGNLCCKKSINPPYDSTKYTDLELFLPYNELSGTHSGYVAVSLYDSEDNWVSNSEYMPFEYTQNNKTANTGKLRATGKVVDSSGEPLIGVTVTAVKSTGNIHEANISSTCTDIDGRFSLDAEKGAVLSFMYVGMEDKIVTFDGQPLNITLNESPTSLEKKNTYAQSSSSPKSTTPVASKKATTSSAPKSTAPTAKPAVKFTFRTPDNTKFSDSNFKISFVTNSKSLTYRISGQPEQYSIPAADISAGVHTIRLPKRSCELTIIDEAQKFHVLNFIYDEDRDLRKSSTLHILAIGVNDYPAQNLNSLKYAEADAKAVVDAFVSRHKYTFGNINKTILLGNNVSCQSIEREIDKIADTAKSNDLAIIFFAGHGLVDNLDKYYLATAETTDGETPRKGSFSASSFNEKIAYINCKLVIFIDACYSGKLVEGMRSGGISNAQFFKELRSTKNGTNIYTSSGSTSQSKEDSRYGHGVFTQALIEACDFKNSDVDSDGRITIKEIRNYLERRIPELTKNQQKPIHRNLEEIDYPLFVK